MGSADLEKTKAEFALAVCQIAIIMELDPDIFCLLLESMHQSAVATLIEMQTNIDLTGIDVQ